MTSLSIWPVVTATICAVLVGYAWYHPKVFGSLWMREAGITPEMAERGARHMHVHYLSAFVGSLMSAFVLHLLFVSLEISAPIDALRLAGLMWLGFVVPMSLGAVLWEHRSITFYLLTISYWLVVLLLMSIILIL